MATASDDMGSSDTGKERHADDGEEQKRHDDLPDAGREAHAGKIG